MSKEIKSEVLIKASASKVWNVLTDFERYPAWNPFIKSISGNLREGAQLEVFMQSSGQKGMAFKPRLLVVAPNRKLQWIGKLLISGLFDGKHTFEIIEQKDGMIRFVQSERFSGMLVPLFKTMIDVGTREAFVEFNHKIKQLAEAAS